MKTESSDAAFFQKWHSPGKGLKSPAGKDPAIVQGIFGKALFRKLQGTPPSCQKATPENFFLIYRAL